ncbi:hypothetical protein [Asticcacaulis solisilvae]|uniref:hypothetical protein n=1 Tax=Asticcacaulis solisilvae TaxID=1217274 RepID=UPI003FD83A75
MPRSYQSGTGASMSGRTYEPQVTPWERNDDDFDVYQSSTYDRDRQASGRYGPDDDYAPSAGDRRYTQNRDGRGGYRSNDGQDAYTRRDLQPSYQDAYERDRERYGRQDDKHAYRGSNHDRGYDRDLLGERRDDRRDDRQAHSRDDYRDDRYLREREQRDHSGEDRPWTGFARSYDRRR